MRASKRPLPLCMTYWISGLRMNSGNSAISRRTLCLASPCSFLATASYQPTSLSNILQKNRCTRSLPPTLYLLVDEESGLSVASVAHIETPPALDWFIVEVEADLGLGVAVDEPEEIGVLVLDSVLSVMLLSQESRSLSHIVVRRALYIEVLGEIGRSLRAKVDLWREIRHEFGQIQLQFGPTTPKPSTNNSDRADTHLCVKA
jgi:hypothetical protein